MLRALALSLLAVCSFAHAEEGKWNPLFNGKDLTGWTPKFKGSKPGENFNDTFRVQDGTITVSYDKYDQWGGQFGHLFYKEKFSNYKLRIEYRFIGDQVKGGPAWAFRNNGVMIHSESPETMGVDQEFPTSLEVQFLGGKGDGKERGSGNLCTPGTNVVIDGQLVTDHVVNAKPQVTIDGDAWVTMEVEVRGNKVIKHFVNGQQVHLYEQPQLDERDKHSQELMKKGASKLISEGYICLQAETHPVQFRKVEIQKLEE
jgi:hypothetical protein